MSPLIQDSAHIVSPTKIVDLEKLEQMLPYASNIELPQDLLKEIENAPNPARFTDIQLIEELENFAMTLT